jgi:glutamine synthetase
LRYADALTMADHVMTQRIVIKEIAQQHGCYATFMPKPIFGLTAQACMCTNLCSRASVMPSSIPQMSTMEQIGRF